MSNQIVEKEHPTKEEWQQIKALAAKWDSERAELTQDKMLSIIEAAGYTWHNATPVSPNGYEFRGYAKLPFYLQVKMVYGLHVESPELFEEARS